MNDPFDEDKDEDTIKEPSKLLTPEEVTRITRIYNEAMGDLLNKIQPKRIYPDDAIFMVLKFKEALALTQYLLKRLDDAESKTDK